ncbi:TPA: hypothetical protein ACX78H_001622 [Campylobacter jejuni]|uniref:hypothetical protein n=1 Tax=Campylobacter jejuni TaxID=197 RepID=UPI001E554409|nr:hypothetical protein [Campylobacter jejuni]KAJ9791866.1 hypothetical protein QR346_00535 [Campylobacter jejuni]KAJ9925737.1 hypothetical protein QR447_02040 [Campylobacter jejuni]KAK0026824.1 hypothetical protein QR537_04015 [Campylobacter jejuni]MCW1866333.1 hypothetical protein [Campylobacter jejuni]MDC8072752.1 hypothetical protein [Campylobacter jejuni]
MGTGFFKTSASVTVRMLYKQNDTRCDTGYTIFYIGINIVEHSLLLLYVVLFKQNGIII